MILKFHFYLVDSDLPFSMLIMTRFIQFVYMNSYRNKIQDR